LYPRIICAMLSQGKEVSNNDDQKDYKKEGPYMQVPQFMLGFSMTGITQYLFFRLNMRSKREDIGAGFSARTVIRVWV